MRTKITILIATIVVAVAGTATWFLMRSDKTDTSSDKQRSAEQDSVDTSISLNVSEDSLLLTQEKESLQVAIRAEDYAKIARVEYLLDDTLAEYVTNPPFTADIDLSGLSIGEHTLQAVAYYLDGTVVKSEIFTFTITGNTPAEATDQTSQSIVRRSVSIGGLKNSSGSNNGSSGNNSGGNGSNPGPGDTTPWPDEPPALICGATSLLSGPSSAPAGAVIVPAGSNEGFDFNDANKTYWFAPGVHTLGTSDPDGLNQIIPGNNATFVGAPGAILDGQNYNKYAFTQHATNVKIQYLTIQNFRTPQNEGTVNHDSGVGWLVEYNTIQNNGGAGLFGGSDNILRYNCLKDNGQYGFQVYSNGPGGPSNVLLDHNEIAGNNTDDWESQIVGCGCTGGGKFWEASNVTITNNYVHDNLSVGLWADTNDNDFLIEGNYIEENDGQGIFYEISYNMIVRNNNFIRNALVDGPGNPSFPTGAIYLSEAGGDSRVLARTDKVEIYNNQFIDNWSGVVLWENADRFCNSPANTSGGTCTLVNPAATLTTCSDPTISSAPYYSDCRWKTNNVKVHDNVFSINRDNITGCTINKSCGFQGIFSNVGTFPTWSPYKGDVIQEAITFSQNNLFSNNTYLGDWRFRAKTEATVYNFAIWQSAPYNQDAGSTYNGQSNYVVANALDNDTATFEGSIGKWIDWFSTTPVRSNEQAHTGNYSMKVTLAASFWGIQLSDSAGFPVTPHSKTVSFWGKLGTGNVTTKLRLIWLDDAQTSIRQDDVVLGPLTTSWQQVTAPITPPDGSATVRLQFLHGVSSGSGSNGTVLYLDDIIIADNN